MKALLAGEYSGIIRDELSLVGWDAWSCDLLPTESELTKKEGKHYQCDVRDILNDYWDLLIAHPYCTYNANSGVRWLHTDISRWFKMFEGIEFFKLFMNATHIPFRAIEHPQIHKYARQLIGAPPTQIIHPWQFGHGETKATLLWLYGLPKLKPTNIVSGREQRIWKLPPSNDRAKERSKTFPGIAKAMAEQWTEYIKSENRNYGVFTMAGRNNY